MFEIEYFFEAALGDGRWSIVGSRFRRLFVWWKPATWLSRWTENGKCTTKSVKRIRVSKITPQEISKACRVNGEIDFRPDEE